MKIIVNRKKDSIPYKRDTLYLREDEWNDYNYFTTFDATYCDESGKNFKLGKVHIGFKGMKKLEKTIDIIPQEFNSLPKKYFSLGWDESYYENVSGLGDVVRKSIHSSLRDMAFDLAIFDENKTEEVVEKSLLRDCTDVTVRKQLHRMAEGGARLTKYNFQYSHPEHFGEGFSLDFNIVPESYPPTNVHVLIGRNGTGKTTLIQDMVMSLITNDHLNGTFINLDDTGIFGMSEDIFSNVLCVAYGPFDDFPMASENKENDTFFSYVGLNKKSSDLLEDIQKQFILHFKKCMDSITKQNRWLEMIEILESDPLFAESDVETFVDTWNKGDNNGVDKETDIENMFKTLSSGHKVILLIVTACVDKLEEKSIVFLDEPENHLHPPLLSAFIRALSTLLINRNGVAIISTHSPVVLQEVPKSCVWLLNRTNDFLTAERLDTETFGTTISSLTRDVFGLEVTRSGFHKMIIEAVNENKNCEYDAIVQKTFGDQLGDEAQYLLRALLSVKKGVNS